jgi:hypothetical protein
MFCIRAEYLGLEAEIFLCMREAVAWLNTDKADEAAPAGLIRPDSHLFASAEASSASKSGMFSSGKVPEVVPPAP